MAKGVGIVGGGIGSLAAALRLWDKLLLKQLMGPNEPIYQSYLLKERLRGIRRHPWRYFGALRR